jgi:type IV pilus assembly protein PilE
MRQSKGFTLIEIMVVVAIVAILAAIAIPSYTDYVTRSKLQEATTNLSDLRVRMEQYYLDNRRYSATAAGGICGIPGGNTPAVANPRYFTYACASATLQAGVGDQSYTITATGAAAQGMGGFVLTINQANTRRTAGVGAGWTVPAADCWVRRKGGEC